MSFPEQLTLRCGPVNAVDLALFAAASGDHNPLHLDVETARRAGFDRPVVHGMLTMAFAARLFTQEFGVPRVRALKTRFVGVALLGDVIEFKASLRHADTDSAVYELEAATLMGTQLATGCARIAVTA